MYVGGVSGAHSIVMGELIKRILIGRVLVKLLRDRYQRIETGVQKRTGGWSTRRRWIVFVLAPLLVLCCCGGVIGVPLVWLTRETIKAGQGQPTPDAAVNAYLMALSYANEDGLLPLLDNDHQAELLAQWRAYRDAMKATKPAPFKLEFGSLTVGPIVGGRADVSTDVTAVWSGTDANGRLTGYQSDAHTWTFQTRDDGGWRVSAVDAPVWCGQYVRADACHG